MSVSGSSSETSHAIEINQSINQCMVGPSPRHDSRQSRKAAGCPRGVPKRGFMYLNKNAARDDKIEV
jgi:hypothetical protein